MCACIIVSSWQLIFVILFVTSREPNKQQIPVYADFSQVMILNYDLINICKCFSQCKSRQKMSINTHKQTPKMINIQYTKDTKPSWEPSFWILSSCNAMGTSSIYVPYIQIKSKQQKAMQYTNLFGKSYLSSISWVSQTESPVQGNIWWIKV